MGTDFPQDSRRVLLRVLHFVLVFTGVTLLHAAPPLDGVWQSVFDDHFTGKSINVNYWSDATPSNIPSSGAPESRLLFTRPLIKQHRLRFFLTLQKSADKKTSIISATGPVQTINTFHLQYGYIEMRVRVPKGPYLCAARLLPADNVASTAAITIFTTDSAPPGGLCGGVTLSDETTERTQKVALSDATSDMTLADHVIGLNWTPQDIVWYVDGQAVARSTQVPRDKMYLALTFQWAKPAETNPTQDTPSPAEFLISEVHIYHKVGEIDTAPPLILTTHLDTHLALETSSTKQKVLPDGTYSTDTYYAERHYVSAITLVFDESLEKNSAEEVSHYQVNGAKVTHAKLNRDKHTVVLELKEVDQHDLSVLHINGVQDLNGNTALITITIGNNPFVLSPRL